MPILLFVFFLSGACALAYQIIWIRLFGLVFGGTVVSMSVIIAVFMGGLALGSHVIGRYAVRVGNRVRLYGILEIILGVLAAIIPYIIMFLSGIVYNLPFTADVHTFAGISVRILLSTAILIVPTMIMGGSLPVLVRAVTSDRKKIILNTSALYAVNTLGAMAGASIVGFFLIRYIGVTNSNLLAAFVNCAMGAAAIAVSGRFPSTPDTEDTGTSEKPDGPEERGRRFLVALGVTGFAGLALEMVWMRMMLLVFNNTIYLYTIVITIYLFALGLGGLVLRLIPDRMRTERVFGLILALTALTVLLGFSMFPATTAKGVSNYAYYATFPRLSVLTLVIFLFLGFAPVLLMGLSFPLGLGLYARKVRGLSRRLGLIYAINTIGSLAGSIAAVFLLIPSIGMIGTVILCAAMIFIPSLYILLTRGTGLFRYPASAAASILFLILMTSSAATGIPSTILARRLQRGETIEYMDQGSSSTIWISGGGAFRKIWMDNLWVSSTSNEGTHALLAHYPVLFHPDPDDVCGIAFGTGQTFGTCLLYPIDNIVSVEIDAAIIEACRGRFTEENYGILKDPRNTVVIDDGRFFLAGTDRRFDLVTAEPLQPYTRGTVSLYSREFYESCKRTLEPGGIVAQWLPVYNSGVDDNWSMVRTFAESFDHVLLFLNGNDGILLGSDREMRIDPSRRLPEAVEYDLKRIENDGIYALAANFICSRDALLEASAGYPLITDDRPTLEFTAPITHWSEDVTAEVEMRRHFIDMMEPLETIMTGNVDWERARTYREARQLVNEGFYHERTGNFAEAYKRYDQAWRTNPDDMKTVKALFLFLRKTNRLDMLPEQLKNLIPPNVRTR